MTAIRRQVLGSQLPPESLQVLPWPAVARRGPPEYLLGCHRWMHWSGATARLQDARHRTRTQDARELMQLAYRATVAASVLISHGAGIHRAGGDFASTATRASTGSRESGRRPLPGPGQMLTVTTGR